MWRQPNWRGRSGVETFFPSLFESKTTLIWRETLRDYGWDRKWYLRVEEPWEEVREYLLLTQAFLVTGPGILKTYTSDPTWNNGSNSIECVGAGASGGVFTNSSATNEPGGGGAAYSKILNFVFATPGTTTAQYEIGAGGAAQSIARGSGGDKKDGLSGGSTWFNAASDPGNGSDNTKVSADGGSHGTDTSNAPGGLTTASWGQTKFAGGTSHVDNATKTNSISGGGGSGGPSGAGVDATAPGVNNTGGAGGAADNGLDGAGGAGASNNSGSATGSPGGGGTCFDASHGTGGGGGGAIARNNGGATAIGGAGGQFGGGGGGAGGNNDIAAASGAGSQGIIGLTWDDPSTGVVYSDVGSQVYKRVSVIAY